MEDKIDQLTEESHADRESAEARLRDTSAAAEHSEPSTTASIDATNGAAPSGFGPMEVFAFLIGFVLVGGLVFLAAWAGGLLPGSGPAGPEPSAPLSSEVRVERDEISFPVADFEFTDQDGEPFGSADLRGQWWVAGFIFTNCASTCPPMTVAMRRIQDEIADLPPNAAHLVFFSVDPDNDTPEVLTRFGERYGADFDRWTLLTGDRETIWDFAKTSFRLGVGDDPENAPMPILHSRRFALVSPEGRITAFFDGLAPNEVADLIATLRKNAEG